MTPAPAQPGAEGADLVAEAIERLRGEPPHVLVVAIDGYGGSGKSTLAGLVARRTGATVLAMDAFFRQPPGDGAATLADYYDYGRIRAEALEPLRQRRPAVFVAFDWATGAPGAPGRAEPADVVLLDGVSSGAATLGDLVDLAVFVDTPEAVRLERLHGRLSDDEWDERWLEAEGAYYATRPPSSFDLIVPGTSAG